MRYARFFKALIEAVSGLFFCLDKPVMSNSKFIGGEFQSRLDAESTKSAACHPARIYAAGLKAGSLVLGTMSHDSESGRSGSMTLLHAAGTDRRKRTESAGL